MAKNNFKKAIEEERLANIPEEGIIATMNRTIGDELHTVKDENDNIIGVSGNGYVNKLVIINGIPCLTQGRTEQERQEDEEAARNAVAAHGNNYLQLIRDTDVAEQLVEAELTPTMEFTLRGETYLYFEQERCARALTGEKVADLADIPDLLSTATAIELLKARI